MKNWINVNDDKPVVGEYVLLLLEGQIMLKGRLCNNGWSAYFADGEKLVGTREVTHWMPEPTLPGEAPKENKDTPVFPVLGKRELIAAHIDVSKDMDSMSIVFFKELMGTDIPASKIDNFKWWAAAEAKVRLIKADALLLELSKSQP